MRRWRWKMSNFNKGSTLLDQTMSEGTPTWGCKSGVIDTVDVISGLTDLRNLAFDFFRDELAFAPFIDRFNEIMGTHYHGGKDSQFTRTTEAKNG